MDKVMMIAIAGASGSGKTTLAMEIERRIGERIILLSHDSYYKRHDELSLEQRKKLNYDHPDALETELLVEHLLKLKSGEAIDCPQYDFTMHNRSDQVTHITPKKVIVVEGILVLQNPALREMMDLKIFVDAPADICLWRRIKRDVAQRGRSLESVLSQYKDTVRPMYKQFVEPSKDYANIIIPNGGKDKAVQDMIVNYILAHLDTDTHS